MSKWIHQGDKVVVIAGNEKGKTGKVLRRTKNRVVVEGLNMRKKCVKRSEELPQGRILSIEGSMDISNVSLCDQEGRAVKIKVRTAKNGERELFYVSGGSEVVHRSVKG